MSAAAPPTTLPRSSSNSRRQHALAPQQDRQHYSPTSPRSQAPSSPRRSNSQSQSNPQSHSRTSSGVQPQLVNVARRDFEQSNVVRPPSSSHRDNRDQGTDTPPTRTDSTRHTNNTAVAATAGANAAPTPSSRSTPVRRQSDAPTNGAVPEATNRLHPNNMSGSGTARRRTTIEATTGVWELGKTIGAGSMGKVKLARNRETHEQVAVKIVPRQSTDEHRSQQERERADHSKEVRTAREAAIVTLVDHPYICGMRDVVKTNYHWYMLFEYVNGGQMLDYIISHGKLKEKQARKFGRQIASALDYCHRNSIVHRDLKIENILISKTGDIKIIDFGLSNTFAPKSHLKTFCGSLYFAAPELLQAKAYTGPEVDIWSFGIVLYVLVCGKVPFDDQSMPQLHAKIKKGVVEYPPWLSSECRSLIARMLVTDPTQRATLAEITNHPWMTKGFGGPPDNFLPPRKPLQLPLDPIVVQKMTGFDFGSADTIESQLTKIIESEDYQRAVKNFEKRTAMPTPDPERKRGVFDFYKRRNSTTSRDTLPNSSQEAVQLGADPVNAYSPLISVYFLAKEKIEREQKESNPGALSIPKLANEKPVQPAELQPPQAAYTNTAAYEMAGEKPTGGRSRPRARTHGEDDAAEEIKNIRIQEPTPPPTIVVPQAEQTPQRKESTAAGIFRRLSTRRHRDAERSTQSPPVSLAASSNGTDAVPSGPRKSFSVRRPRESSQTRGLNPPEQKGDGLLSPSPPAEAASRRIGLGRSTSVNSGDYRSRTSRRGASEGSSMRPPRTPQLDRRSSMDPHRSTGEDTVSDLEPSGSKTAPPASRARSLGHARRESIQARRAQRANVRTSNVPEETDAEIAEQDDDDTGDAGAGTGSPSGIKPVFLKGLFSVSTTSSKPFKTIEADIIRVLKQLGVDFSSNHKGGFKCRHSPSINVQQGQEDSEKGSSGPPPSQSHRRKISLSGFISGDREKDDTHLKAPRTPNSTRSGRRGGGGGSGGEPDQSFTNSEDSEAEDNAAPLPIKSTPMSKPAGETSTHVQHDLGSNMALKFEIFIVKVPFLNLHGIQFKKVDGGTWQYKNMAQTILNELRL